MRRALSAWLAAACRNAPRATAGSIATRRWWWQVVAMPHSPRRIHLAEFARSVTIVTRGEMFRARRSYVSRVADDERFKLRWTSEIVEVLGDKGVEGVRVRDNEAGNDEVVPCSGLFV